MPERFRSLAITVAIAGGSVAAVFIAMRFALGSNLGEFFAPVGEAIWGRDGFTEAIGKFISPIFQPRQSQGEKAAESKRNEFERLIAEGKPAKEAFARVGITSDVVEDRAGLNVIAVSSLRNALLIKQTNVSRAKSGLPPLTVKGDWIRPDFESFIIARGETLSSFGVPGSAEQLKALNEFVRTLNLTEIKTLLGKDALQAAVTARALTLEAAS